MKKTFLILFLLSFCNDIFSNIWLPSVFSDAMVLKQNSQTPFWGKADKGETVCVTVTWNNKTYQTKADKAGNWSVMLDTPRFGGPFSITVKGNNTVKINNVMIGEVWLASGQSNMELPLRGWPPEDTVLNASKYIAEADNNNIRMFTTAKTVSFTPQADAEGSWKVCNSETVKDFSATAYFFAKRIYEKTGIPIGIINSSWGGSPCEGWLSREFLKDVPGYDVRLADFDRSIPMQDKLNAWILSHKKLCTCADFETKYNCINFDDEQCARIDFDDSRWDSINLPCYYDIEKIGSYDGVIWFRKTLELPANFVGKNLKLSLGPVDDVDFTFVNGKLIGKTDVDGKWSEKRLYDIPAELTKTSSLTIAVRLVDNGNGGGIYGQKQLLKIFVQDNPSQSLSIAGKWRFLPTAEYIDGCFYAYDIANREYYQRPQMPVAKDLNAVTALYNAMIHPFVPYKLSGVIWYQGETNVSRAKEYGYLLPALIKNWRSDFKNPELEFIYAQIAPFEYGEGTNSQELRDEQLKCCKGKNIGMACLSDIGKKNTAHPAYKFECGNRLALWALNDLYNQPCETSGPMYQSYIIRGSEIELTFSHVGGGLVAKGGTLKDFEIAGNDSKFYPAQAEISGDKVIVRSAEVKNPVKVRYGWHNWLDCVTLYNAEGLPASCFITQ